MFQRMIDDLQEQGDVLQSEIEELETEIANKKGEQKRITTAIKQLKKLNDDKK